MLAELMAILVGAVLLLVVINAAQRRSVSMDREYYHKKWVEIHTLARTSAAASRLAIIEADKLLDHALKESGWHGDTMGERMKQAGNALGNSNAVWTAHKLRNQLVHEQVHPKPIEIRRALQAYEQALKKAGAL